MHPSQGIHELYSVPLSVVRRIPPFQEVAVRPGGVR
jgi:hypothetical protein